MNKSLELVLRSRTLSSSSFFPQYVLPQKERTMHIIPCCFDRPRGKHRTVPYRIIVV